MKLTCQGIGEARASFLAILNGPAEMRICESGRASDPQGLRDHMPKAERAQESATATISGIAHGPSRASQRVLEMASTSAVALLGMIPKSKKRLGTPEANPQCAMGKIEQRPNNPRRHCETAAHRRHRPPDGFASGHLKSILCADDRMVAWMEAARLLPGNSSSRES